MLAVVDTGPLYAAIDADDRNHDRAIGTLSRSDLDLLIPTLVVGEVCYFAATRLGARVEAEFLRSLVGFEVEAPTPTDWRRIGDLVEQYGDFPLGAVDASVMALAERFDTELVVTLDQRHFRAVRPAHRRAFRLLPE